MARRLEMERRRALGGRGSKHADNARSTDPTRKHPLHQRYPAKGVTNIGGTGGSFENLDVYCGMAFDGKKVRRRSDPMTSRAARSFGANNPPIP